MAGLRPRERGLVTVELAVGIVTTVLLAGVLVSLSMLGVAEAACAESSAQLARQAARGDTAQLAEAENRVPPGARVTLRRGDDGVTATVTLDVVLVGLPPVPVSASAWAAYEPGAGP